MELSNTLPFDMQSLMANTKKLPDAKVAKTSPEIEKAAKEFEAIYVGQMLEHMFKGIETDPMTGGGSSEGIYRSMQIQEYAKIITEKGGIGIADALKAELIQMQAQEVR